MPDWEQDLREIVQKQRRPFTDRKEPIEWIRELPPATDILILALSEKDGKLHGQVGQMACDQNAIALYREFLSSKSNPVVDELQRVWDILGRAHG